MIEKRNIQGVTYMIEIIESALKHGKTENDIYAALENCIYDEMIDDDPEKTLSIGFDTNADLTEIIFHEADEQYLVVFHAMACRREYQGKLTGRQISWQE